MTASVDGFILEQKPVFDWNRVPLGHVTTAQRDPKTHATRLLTLELTAEAKDKLGTSMTSIELPVSYIFGMRRDGVTLDRSVSELRKIETFASILKK